MPCVRTSIYWRAKILKMLLILSGDHVYKMDYTRFLEYHRLKNAGLTISAIRVRKAEAAGRLGVLEVDEYFRLSWF